MSRNYSRIRKELNIPNGWNRIKDTDFFRKIIEKKHNFNSFSTYKFSTSISYNPFTKVGLFNFETMVPLDTELPDGLSRNVLPRFFNHINPGKHINVFDGERNFKSKGYKSIFFQHYFVSDTIPDDTKVQEYLEAKERFKEYLIDN